VTQVGEQHAPAREAALLPAPADPALAGPDAGAAGSDAGAAGRDAGAAGRDAGARVRITPGTLMQKLLPPHLVEPYLTSQRSVITGFVHRAEEIALPGPAWLLAAADAGGPAGAPGQDVWVLRWRALEIQSYLAARVAPGPRAGSGARSGRAVNSVYELFLAPGPIPVGTELYRITPAGEEFIARHDGQDWLRPAPVSPTAPAG
jgi:hypothetical protein